MAFETNVFVNCPFDKPYQRLLRPILFCIIELGLEPRIAVERQNAAEPRIQKIIELIEDSKFGIHDLSRLKAKKVGEFYRLNMPLELGLDLGCQRFKAGRWMEKKCLILEAERHQYQAAISDLAGSDIVAHGNNAGRVLVEVRNWLCQEAHLPAAGPNAFRGWYADFTAYTYAALQAENYSDADIRNLPVTAFIDRVKRWKPLPRP